MNNKKSFLISTVIPIFNEDKNITPLYRDLKKVLDINLKDEYEIIFIDDGSTDDSFRILKDLASNDRKMKVVKLKRNFGQTAALAAGIKCSMGDILILMDGDLQNDPKDIPMMISKINEGYDVVSGWRKNRKDSLSKKIPSYFANKIISWVTGIHLRDYGCTLKAYRKEVIKMVKLYGEMHRFLPALLDRFGAKIIEVPVSHHSRAHGRSKYGLSRASKVLLDMVTVKFLGTYSTNPIYFFGMVGFPLCIIGVILAAVTLFQKFIYNIWVHKNPLLLLAVFLFIVGILFMLLGLVSEVVMRTYYESQDRDPFYIEKIIN